MLATAIVFISTALVLYSVSIWMERIIKALKPWMVKTFFSAFMCDLVGTSLMFFQKTDMFQLNLHSICGYTALIIMGLHLSWAVVSLYRKGLVLVLFHRFSIFAWLIWLIAFISGMPKV